jgi:hypothetical protein
MKLGETVARMRRRGLMLQGYHHDQWRTFLMAVPNQWPMLRLGSGTSHIQVTHIKGPYNSRGCSLETRTLI